MNISRQQANASEKLRVFGEPRVTLSDTLKLSDVVPGLAHFGLLDNPLQGTQPRPSSGRQGSGALRPKASVGLPGGFLFLLFSSNRTPMV